MTFCSQPVSTWFSIYNGDINKKKKKKVQLWFNGAKLQIKLGSNDNFHTIRNQININLLKMSVYFYSLIWFDVVFKFQNFLNHHSGNWFTSM